MKEVKEDLLKEQINVLLEETNKYENLLSYQDIQFFLSKSQPIIYCRHGFTETDVNVSIIEFGKILEFLKRNVACTDIFLRIEQSVTSEYHRQMKKQRLSLKSNSTDKVAESEDSEDDSTDSDDDDTAPQPKVTQQNLISTNKDSSSPQSSEESPLSNKNEEKIIGKKRKSDPPPSTVQTSSLWKRLLRKKYRQVIKVLRGYAAYLEIITEIKFSAISVCMIQQCSRP